MTPARSRRAPPWYQRIHPATWALLVLLAAASASLLVRTLRNAPAARPLQVQVMNGSGVPELAQRAATALRARGLDVVAIGNADSPEYRQTLVLLRRGGLGAARQVAGALGRGEVLEQLDATLLVDVTVILGRDYDGGAPPR